MGELGDCKEQPFLSCRIDVLIKKGRKKEKERKKSDEVRERNSGEPGCIELSRPLGELC